MTTTRSYEYGSIGVALSFSEVAQLRAVYNQTQAAFILNAEQQGLAYPIYDTLLKFLPKPGSGLSPAYASKEYNHCAA